VTAVVRHHLLSTAVDVAIAIAVVAARPPRRPRRVGVGLTWRIRRPPARDVARWATRRDARPLAVDKPTPGRLSLGTARGRLLAAESGHSVFVVGPTQSGKTSGLAVPALLEWEGPVVAASVKSDLVHHSVGWRRQLGTVWVYDPTGVGGFASARWSPLDAADTWTGARRMAGSLTEVARASAGNFADGDFWYAVAAKLIAPLLLAAAISGRSMSDVVMWVDEHEVDEVADVLAAAGNWDALRAARASWGRDGRQRSAVYTTAETVLEAFADPAVAAASAAGAIGDRVDPVRLLDGDNTLFLCAPAHDQRRLRPIFATMVTQVIETAYARATRSGRPIDRPLLVLLDEAANVAPLAELDVLASTAAGHGVQLVTVWQDLGQLTARYGARAGSVVNNHRVKLFLSGIADVATLEHASALVGDAVTATRATTVDGRGGSSTTTSPSSHRLVPADALRRVPPGAAIAVSGHLPPVRVELRPWYEDRRMRGRARTAAPFG